MKITSHSSTYDIDGLKIDQRMKSVIVQNIEYHYPNDISNTDIRFGGDKIFIGNYQLDYKNNQWVKNDISSIFKRNVSNPNLKIYNFFIIIMLVLLVFVILGIALT